jgi:hypothetical protein
MAERDNILHLRDQKDKIRWKNLSGEVIPAYAVVKLSSYNAVDKHYNAVKPDGEGSIYHLSGPVAVAVDAYGESVMWNTAVLGLTIETFGTVVGPVAGSWEMSLDGTGFVVFSDKVNDVAAIVKSGGTGGTGGGHTIWFTIADVLCPESDYTSETTLVAVPTYYNQGCDAIPPGAEYDGTYLVYDICNYLSGLTPADMLMTTGRATYMYPMTGACEPRWIIDDLCAQPECI